MIQEFSVLPTRFEGLWQVQTKMTPDDRGSVMESFRASDYEKSGLPPLGGRLQVNATLTKKGALRGIHAEEAHKFIQVAQGKIFAVIVDLRKGSSTAGQSQSFYLERGQGLFVSSGLGNSFQSVSDEPSIYIYHFEKEWTPDMPGVSCNPLDPDLKIDWPIPEGAGMIISEKDRNNPSFKEVLNG